MDRPRQDLGQIVFGVLIIFGLLAVSIWVLVPFLAAIVWATTLVVATWPILEKLQKWFGGRRWAAVLFLTVVLLALVVIPFLLGLAALLGNREEIGARVEQLKTMEIPPAPSWLAGIPLVGPKLAAAWGVHSGEGVRDILAAAAPFARQALNWLVGTLGSLGALFGQLLLTVVVSAVFYGMGDTMAAWLRRFARRVGGERGANAIVLAGQAIRGVALGVVVTAVSQSLLSGIGLAIAGVPFAGALTVVALILCIAQVGPILLLVPAIIWLYSTGQTGWGTFLLVWSIPCVTMDNIIRPILIKKGADLPLLLIFTGVIGGLVSFGLMGIFVGPVVLAVSHTLVDAWIEAGETGPPGDAA